jgi:hypothetical protein
VPRKPHAETWAERGFKNAGMLSTARGLKFAMGWGLFMASEGREPENIDEYAEVMQESRATAYRDQQAFRQAFPDEESPTRMNKVSGAQERYNEVYRRLQDVIKSSRQIQPVQYTLGAAPAL